MSGVHHLFRFISYKRKKKKKRWMPLCSPHCQHRIPLKTRKKTLVNTESTNEKRGRKRAMLLLYGTQHVPHTFVWTWKRRPGVSIFHQPSHNSFEPLAGPTALEKSFFSPIPSYNTRVLTSRRRRCCRDGSIHGQRLNEQQENVNVNLVNYCTHPSPTRIVNFSLSTLLAARGYRQINK